MLLSVSAAHLLSSCGDLRFLGVVEEKAVDPQSIDSERVAEDRSAGQAEYSEAHQVVYPSSMWEPTTGHWNTPREYCCLWVTLRPEVT